MRHNRPDYDNRFRDPAAMCAKHGVPVGRWAPGPGYVTAPDGTLYDLVTVADAGSRATYPRSYRLASVIADMLTCPSTATPIPDDEPVFLLRGQDVAAPTAVRAWAARLEIAHGDPEIMKNARAVADAMEEWQRKHGVKVADWPRVLE